jgi:hypothetical protein
MPASVDAVRGKVKASKDIFNEEVQYEAEDEASKDIFNDEVQYEAEDEGSNKSKKGGDEEESEANAWKQSNNRTRQQKHGVGHSGQNKDGDCLSLPAPSKPANSLQLLQAGETTRHGAFENGQNLIWALGPFQHRSADGIKKIPSLIDHEDVRLMVLQWLRSSKGNITAARLQKHISKVVFSSLWIEKKTTSRSAAKKSLGWEYKANRKGIHVDGHERSDVIEYQRQFLSHLDELKEEI